MIELYISTSIDTDTREIATLLLDENVESQVSENHSSIVHKNTKKRRRGSDKCNGVVEKGYKILLLNVANEDFKEKVWNILEKKYSLKCAYVKADRIYMGCVKNWAGVFCKTNCPLNNGST